MLLVLSPALDAREHVTHASQTAQKGTVKTTPKRSTRSRKGTRRRRTGTGRRRTTRAKTPTPRLPNIAAVPNEVGWEKFSSTDGRFSVLMPAAPTDTTETVESEHGPYTTHLFVARDSTKRVFLVGWVDYQPTFNFDRQSEMEANRDNFVNGVRGRLVSSRPVILDGYRALEFTAENDEKIYKSRVYMVGRRPYQIVIGLPKGQDDAAMVNRFFNSFKISVN